MLEEINRAVNGDGSKQLGSIELQKYRQRYQEILKEAEKESPPPDESKSKGKRGWLKRTKSRNLLERLQNFEEDVLRFMDNEIIPFTNNLGENGVRMTKVQQKICGCFRSKEDVQFFCRIRSYISSRSVSENALLPKLFVIFKK